MPGASNVAWGGATLTVVVSSVDVSCDVLTCTVDRSKNRLWDPADAGLCQVTLDMTSGGVDAATGPVGDPVTVHVAYGAAARYLFTGVVQRRRLIHDPIGGDQVVLDCVDGFERLSRVNVRADVGDSTVGGGETPGQRIARWLDVADWSIDDRVLASSTYTCPATLLDGNVLLQIQAATFADGGEFFIDGAGVATFYAWAWRTAGGDVAAVFSDRRLHDWVPYSAATLTDDLDEVQNQVSGLRRAIDGEMTPPVVQTVENTGSITAYGPRGDPLDDLELVTDEQVADRITALVTIAGMPSPRFDQIVVQPAFEPGRCWPRVIPCTFGSLVAANRLWEDGHEDAFYGHVIGELWRFTGDDASVEWRISGTGAWDANGPPRPPVCVVIDPGGCLRVCEGTPCNDTDEVIFRDADGDPIGDPLPPGSLCDPEECVIPPEGAVEVCYVNDFGVACFSLDDKRIEAILWFDTLNDSGDLLIERVDGDPVAHGPAFADTVPGVLYDEIHGSDLGGLIGGEHSTHLEDTSLTGGWTVDWWMQLPAVPGGTVVVDIIDLDTIVIRLSSVAGLDWTLQAVVFDGLLEHISDAFAEITDTDWHRYVVTWDPDETFELVCLVDGVEV